MVKVVSTRSLPPECRSRELYAPVLYDRTERLTEEERLAIQAAAKREQRRRKKSQEKAETPAPKRMIQSKASRLLFGNPPKNSEISGD